MSKSFEAIADDGGKIWKIGVLVCLTGACAEVGTNSVEGIKLAVDEVNRAGGVLGHRLELRVENTDEGNSSGAGAVTAFQKLSQDPSIQYFIGPTWTPGGLSVAPIAAKRTNIVITSPTLGVADFNRAGSHLFNLWPHDELASKYLAKFALEKGWKRAAIFSSQQPWEVLQGNTFDAEFKRLGGTVVAKQEPLPTTTDLRSESLKIRHSKPDVIFLSNYTQMGVASNRLRKIGYSGPYLAILMDDTQIETAQGALDKVIYASYPPPDSGFSERFNAQYDKQPGIAADTAYDVIKLYAWAVNEAQTFDPTRTKKAIIRAEMPGASGYVQFDEFGGVRKSPVLYQVVGSDRVPM